MSHSKTHLSLYFYIINVNKNFTLIIIKRNTLKNKAKLIEKKKKKLAVEVINNFTEEEA